MSNSLQDTLGLSGGLLTLLVGPPGTGKSYMAGTIDEVSDGKTHLLAFKPKEVDSYKYREHEIEYDLFHDPRWSPSVDSYEAEGWTQFVRRMDELLVDDEVENVILDPLTDLHLLIKHEVLKKENASQMNQMSDGRGAWGDVRELWEEAANKITSLAFAPTPKNVAAVVHAKVPSEEEQERREVEYMGTTLPAIQGSFKTILEGEFHLVLHTKVEKSFNQQTREQEENYKVETRAGSGRHNKVAIAPKLDQKLVDNDFRSLIEAVQGANSDR